jgi:hypothetical protein
MCACNDWQFYDPHPLIADVIISSKIGVPKGVLIDIWGSKWVKVLHKLKFYIHLNKFSHYIGLMPPRPAGYW